MKTILIDCPECGGSGWNPGKAITTDNIFWNPFEKAWKNVPTTSQEVEVCKRCDGKGKVWVDDSYFKTYGELKEREEKMEDFKKNTLSARLEHAKKTLEKDSPYY